LRTTRCSTDSLKGDEERMAQRDAILGGAAILFTVGGWVAVNPGGEFDTSRFGLTTYARVPIPVIDVQVRGDGAFRPVLRSHAIDDARLRWLLSREPPEVLIVGVGWESTAKVASTFHPPDGTKLLVLPTDEAIATYNSLKADGVRVAIHVHSTC
jgi:hypothetical protein